jgi:hypothetical protein
MVTGSLCESCGQYIRDIYGVYNEHELCHHCFERYVDEPKLVVALEEHQKQYPCINENQKQAIDAAEFILKMDRNEAEEEADELLRLAQLLANYFLGN